MQAASAPAAAAFTGLNKDTLRKVRSLGTARSPDALVALLVVLLEAAAAGAPRGRRSEAEAEEAARARAAWRRLQSLWRSSIAQVALEFDYAEDNVALILAQFAANGEQPRNAAHLVDLLEDLDAVGEGLQPFGLADFLRNGDPFAKPVAVREPPAFAPVEKVRDGAPCGAAGPAPLQPEEPQASRQELLKETAHLMRSRKCANCRQEDADRLIVDCGHLALCKACEKRDSCPLCGTKVTYVVQVFLS